MRWLAVGAAACVALGVIVLADPQVLESAGRIVTTNAQEVESEDSTWAWRVEGYDVAAARLVSSEPVDILIGPPAGWAAEAVGESFASTTIHSRYIATLANYGIVGFAVLLLWFGMLAKRVGWPTKALPERSARDYVGTPLLEALLLSELVYMVPYNGVILEGAVLGLIWVAAQQNHISIGVERASFPSNRFDSKIKPATLVS
jgi:hypothetical protein